MAHDAVALASIAVAGAAVVIASLDRWADRVATRRRESLAKRLDLYARMVGEVYAESNELVNVQTFVQMRDIEELTRMAAEVHVRSEAAVLRRTVGEAAVGASRQVFRLFITSETAFREVWIKVGLMNVRRAVGGDVPVRMFDELFDAVDHHRDVRNELQEQIRSELYPQSWISRIRDRVRVSRQSAA